MSNQLFEEETPTSPAPKNGRSPRAPRVPEPADTLSDPFAEEETPVLSAEPPVAPQPLPEPPMPAAPVPVPAAPPVVSHAGPRVLPDERQSVTHTLKAGGCEGLLVVGLYDDGTPGEVLLVLRRAPSGAAPALEALTETLNLALPYGVPVGALTTQLTRLISAEAREAGQYIAHYLTSKFG